MRFLNTSTLELENFLGPAKPPYAILSHTWEPEGEFLFEDLTRTKKKEHESKPGYAKVRHTCQRALKDGCQYVWIDTCCIDKSSSAELSEAINSMFRWYEESRVCYAFLSDVAPDRTTFTASRWFSRGWTLQELVAPNRVAFLNANWQDLGDREQLADHITEATGIDRRMLVRPGCRAQDVLYNFSVAQRMKWASARETSRMEDSAYCLMGLFDVNMPLLYEEGNKAFRRLQEAIINESADHSILAFRSPLRIQDPQWGFTSVLATRIQFFTEDIRPEWAQNPEPPQIQNGNITLTAYTTRLNTTNEGIINPFAPSHIACLDCVFEDDYLSRPAILLKEVGPGRFKRCGERSLPVLLQTTSTSFGQYTVSVGGNIPFEIPNHRSMRKERITIENEKLPNGHQRTYHRPIILDFSALKHYCNIGPSYPTPRNNEWCLTAFDFIGVVTLSYEGEIFLVFWGNNPGPWSCIQTLERVKFGFHRVIGSYLNDDDGADAIVQYIKRHETDVRDLMEIFAGFSSIWGPFEKSSAPHVSVGLVKKLAIRRSYSVMEYIDRKVSQMRLSARIIPIVTTHVGSSH